MLTNLATDKIIREIADANQIDAQVDKLNPFDEPLHSVWRAVSDRITANDDHIGIARAALKAAMHGIAKRRTN